MNPTEKLNALRLLAAYSAWLIKEQLRALAESPSPERDARLREIVLRHRHLERDYQRITTA